MMRGMPVLEMPHVNQPLVRGTVPRHANSGVADTGRETGPNAHGPQGNPGGEVLGATSATAGLGAVISATEPRFGAPLALARNLFHAPQARLAANCEPGFGSDPADDHAVPPSEGFGRPPSPRWEERKSGRAGGTRRVAVPVAARGSLRRSLRPALDVMESPQARDITAGVHNSSAGRRVALLRATDSPGKSECFRRGMDRFGYQPFEIGQGLGKLAQGVSPGS